MGRLRLDRQTLEVERLSVTLQEQQANLHSFRPTLSRDGRYVAFESWAGNLVPDDPNRQGSDIFVRDRWLGTTERVSVGGAPGAVGQQWAGSGSSARRSQRRAE